VLSIPSSRLNCSDPRVAVRQPLWSFLVRAGRVRRFHTPSGREVGRVERQ
jgi:hypothetical protein